MNQARKRVLIFSFLSLSLSQLLSGPPFFTHVPIETRMYSILQLEGVRKRRESIGGKSPTLSRGRQSVRSPIPGKRGHSVGAIDERWKIDEEALRCEMKHLQGYCIMEQRSKEEDGVVPGSKVYQSSCDEFGGDYPPSDNDWLLIFFFKHLFVYCGVYSSYVAKEV